MLLPRCPEYSLELIETGVRSNFCHDDLPTNDRFTNDSFHDAILSGSNIFSEATSELSSVNNLGNFLALEKSFEIERSQHLSVGGNIDPN